MYKNIPSPSADFQTLDPLFVHSYISVFIRFPLLQVPMSPAFREPTTTSSSSSSSSGDSGDTTTISALPLDVLTHILSLLDGPVLASASCASSHLRSLSAHPLLWHRLCTSSWPSINHLPLSDYRSFFSDAFSALPLTTQSPPSLPHPPNLISAVDLRFNNHPIVSTVLQTETRSSWFLTSPFRIDALYPKDPSPLPPPATLSGSTIAAELSLSWIVVDPIARRAANLSSIRPVSVQRHWFSGETQVRFATILGRGSDWVQCGIVVTCEVYCEGERGDGVQVREVCLQVEDMDGMNLNGEESLEILQMAMEGKRKRRREEEGRERYLQYLKRKMERKEEKMRREGRLDTACLVVGLSIFAAFLGFISFL